MTPEDTAELILDLRAIHNHCSNMKNYPEIAKDAADLIEQLQATIARLESQLRYYCDAKSAECEPRNAG